MAGLRGYTTGGTIHIIVNNQVGFTTDPTDSRSTLYASDLAKGFEIPVVHVNADDPEACLAVCRMAMAYRQEFGKDFLIDLVGYRRWGHNEGDEPMFTQPVLYEQINKHPTVRAIWADTPDRLRRDHAGGCGSTRVRGNGSPGRRAPIGDRRHRRGRGCTSTTRPAAARSKPPCPKPGCARSTPRSTRCRTVSRSPRSWLASGSAAPNCSTARTPRSTGRRPRRYAFAATISDGIPIRLSGQDAERGTFSQRHLVLHDPANRRDLDAAAAAARRNSQLRRLQQPALGGGGRRLRVRLQRPCARSTGPLGGAVRRLLQRRPDHDRPVHRRRPGQVDAASVAGSAPAARLRGPGPGALQRAARALLAALGPGQHARRELHDRRAVLPPAAPPGRCGSTTIRAR